MIKSILMSDFVKAKKENVLNIIDIRETYEYDNGHIPEAKNMPLSTFESTYSSLDKSKPYHIICQSGNRSLVVCEFLHSHGYDVTNVEGGTNAWVGPLE